MLNELNFSFKVKSQYNVSFFDTSSSNVVHLLVWQYWWWSLFFFFTILYFIFFFNIFFFKNTKQVVFSLNSIKSNGRWGDLIAGLLPIYWCVNILLNSNMILKVLEWQTETSFCTIRIRGKQWYWVYKTNVLKKNINAEVVFGLNSIFSGKQKNTFFTTNNIFLKTKFFKKQIFLKKINVTGDFFFEKKTQHNVNFFSQKKNHVAFFKNDFNFDYFFITKKNTSCIKKYNRFFFTTQQQPKTEFNSVFTFPFFWKHKLFYKNINDFLKNNILVKNRFISVDNVVFLPARKNITIITNSFDVAHSWFVPGLGLKFDCIPGRSTHNSLFISKPGYYFGHCAEVCGRFHHHMPIKIAAVNADHYVYFCNINTPSFRKKN